MRTRILTIGFAAVLFGVGLIWVVDRRLGELETVLEANRQVVTTLQEDFGIGVVETETRSLADAEELFQDADEPDDLSEALAEIDLWEIEPGDARLDCRNCG